MNNSMKKNTEIKAQTTRKYVNILGINVLVTTSAQVLTGVKQNITDSYKFFITTPNHEIVLMAQKNKELRGALNCADFAVPDGVGLNYASKFLYGKPLNIIPGRKLFLELIKLANKNKWKVFLLGGLDNESEIASRNLQLTNHNLQIQFAGGSEITPNLSKDIVDRINKFSPDLLFAAFGNPKQEIFVHKNFKKLNVGGMMAVGGTFRYISGQSPLPPKWMEELGLEWVYRLITEPYRIKRIWNAFPIFPLRVFWFKITGY